MRYDEDYYERGIESGKSLYTNYRWIPELTIPMCATLNEQLGIERGESILDFGCAKGFIVKAMRLLGRDAYGVDVSEYAIEKVDGAVAKYVDLIKVGGPIPVRCHTAQYDWGLAKDVLEHVSYDMISDVLAELARKCSRLFVAVPLGGNGKYVVDAYNRDVTHMIKEPLEWWTDILEKHFFTESASHTMYNIKENYREHKNGNGFFVLESRIEA